MDDKPIWRVEYNEDGEPMLVEDDGVVYMDNGFVDLSSVGINPDFTDEYGNDLW